MIYPLKKFFLSLSLNLLLLFFSVFLVNSVDLTDINYKDYIKLSVTNEIQVGVDMNKNRQVNFFNIYSFFYPQSFENSQFLNDFQTSYDNYVILNDSGIYYIKYSFSEDDLTNIVNIENDFTLESIVNRPEITKKVSYPLSENYLDDIDERYLGFEGFIDIDEDIRNEASVLAYGEDDVYIIASKVAKWIIADIDYDLDTVFSNPNQKSTQVYESKAGVCREITNLYISMMRSLGIPARVVSGFSFTESEDIVNLVGSNWGGHAWAEVLIGDTWVPFDLTYNQYGFVDATHIVTDKNYELRGTSVSINASGYGFDLVGGSLKSDYSFEVLDIRDSIFSDGFEILVVGPDDVSFDDYGYLKVDVENTDNFYKLMFLKFAAPEEIEKIDSDEVMLIFEPLEKKEVYFRYKVPKLDENYIYTFPFSVYTDFSEVIYNVTSSSNSPKLGLISINEEDKKYSFSENDLFFDCDFQFSRPLNNLNCNVKNPNNFEIQDLNICSELSCEVLNLKVNEDKEFSFQTDLSNIFLNYSYLKQNGSLNFSLEIPSFSYGFELEKNELNITFDVNSKGAKSLNFDIYIDEVLQERNLILDFSNEVYSVNLMPGIHNVRLDFKSNESVLESESFEVEFLAPNVFVRFLNNLAEFFSMLFS